MSHSTDVRREPEYLDQAKIGKWGKVLLWAGIAGITLAFLYGYFQPNQFAFSWLFAWTVFYTLSAGSLFWTLLHYAMDAKWSVVVRRILENVAALFPFLLLAFLPLMLPNIAGELWRWMKIASGADPLLDHKAPYLNVPFFYGRVIFYFAFFIGAALFLKKFSTNQDRDGNPYDTLRMRKFSYAGIPLFMLCLTFAAFDWLMGLDYRWHSTMWGVYIFAGALVSAMALLILISNGLRLFGHLKNILTEEHNHLMGKLLFAFVCFWAYIAFSQYFLYYYANIPEETAFFIHRNEGAWLWVSIFLVIGHFIIPFLLLLPSGSKRKAWRLCPVAAWVLFMHILDIYWIIMPYRQVFRSKALHGLATTGGRLPLHGMDVLCLVSIGALFFYIFLRQLSKHSLYPCRDPRLEESIHLKN